MRDLEKCKAEIFRRSEEKQKKNRKTRNRIISLCIPLCLLIVIAAFATIPGILNSPTTPVDISQSDKSYAVSNTDNSVSPIEESRSDSSTVLKPSVTTSLTEGITPNKINAVHNLADSNAAVTDFAVRLFKSCNESDKNTLISPLSVLCALGMTANGAENDTLKQMESVLGMTTEEINTYLYSYINSLPQEEKYKLSIANSIWFTNDERFSVNPDFLQANVDYFRSDIYGAPFNDETCNDINNWVKDNTDGMIPKIIDKIPNDAVMYLINALAFEADWERLYEKNAVHERVFTKQDGTTQNVEFMHAEENTYLEDDKATGFIKYYAGKKYAFVALLPNEGVSVEEYVSSLNGAKLNALLSNPRNGSIITAIPKFETEYDVEMSKILSKMGMPNAFNPSLAEFGRLGASTSGNIYISRVIHKTFISVAEKGTKAAAVTAVQIHNTGIPQYDKEIYLDRPFVYMLIDCENNIPFFIGTTLEVN